MDYLTYAIHNLSPKERKVLQKRLRKQHLKFRLLEMIEQSENIDNKQLGETLSAGHNSASIYTLKNRLLDDIIDVKLAIGKNELIITKEKIQNLRMLVYSKDKFSLLRELKKAEKAALSLELFAELKEVYFCYFLIYRHDKKKADFYKKMASSNDSEQALVYQSEEIFYTNILNTLDLFYFPNQKIYKTASQDQMLIHQHCNLHPNKTLTFLYLSGLLTLELNDFMKPNQEVEYLRKLNELAKIYQHSFLPYKYPNCDVATQCLFSRFYYITGREAEFDAVQKDICAKISRIKGHQMFDCSFFYFVYVTLLNYVRKGQAYMITGFIDQMVNAEYINYIDSKMKNYYMYILGVREFYMGNYFKSSSYLLKSRNFFNNLDPTSGWVAIENVMLNIVNYMMTNDTKLIDYEVNLLKRLLKKFDLYNQCKEPLHDFFNFLGNIETADIARLKQNILEVQQNVKLMRLVQVPEGVMVS